MLFLWAFQGETPWRLLCIHRHLIFSIFEGIRIHVLIFVKITLKQVFKFFLPFLRLYWLVFGVFYQRSQWFSFEFSQFNAPDKVLGYSFPNCCLLRQREVLWFTIVRVVLQWGTFGSSLDVFNRWVLEGVTSWGWIFEEGSTFRFATW